MNIIERLLADYHRVSNKVGLDCLRDILGGLELATTSTYGDVAELGCNVGTSALFIRRYLDAICSERTFHAYDSWQGLPYPCLKDGATPYTRGDATTRRAVFEENFRNAGLELPIIHDGWFKDAEYPRQIAFAFFDGDFYSSILDSFEAVWPRLAPGGVIVVHDYEHRDFPGVKRAVREFLEPFGLVEVKGLSHTCMVVKQCQ